MDIKKSFKRFKKSYIRESEMLDNEDFVDVDLEGTTENTTNKVYTIEVASVITDENSDAQNVQTYDNITADEIIEKLGEEKANEFFANREITVDFPFDDAGYFEGAEEYAWYIEAEEDIGDSGIEYTDPEENLDAAYDEDFNESCHCGGKKKSNKMLTENKKHTVTKNDAVYSIGRYFASDNNFFDEDGEFIAELEETKNFNGYDEMVSEMGKSFADDIVAGGSYDSGNNSYYKLEYVIDENGEKYSDDYLELDFTNNFDESCCCGSKKKSKKGKKDKKSKFVPFWAKKKDKSLKEALKTLKDAGYSVINECGVDCELEDDATGFGIAFDDSDYYNEEGECEVCAICGKESCDGEYDEDGNFVCSDCAENSLEQPMEEIDPMDIYFRAGRADNIRDMNRFVR